MKIKYFSWLKEITKTDVEIIDDISIKDVKTLKEKIIAKNPKLNLFFKKKKYY